MNTQQPEIAPPIRRHPGCDSCNCEICFEDHNRLQDYFEKVFGLKNDWLSWYRRWLDENKIPSEVNGWASPEAFDKKNIEAFIKA